MNKLPKLTEEERNAALERAMQVRRERAMLKSRFKSGTVSVEEAMGEDCAQKMRVTQFIKSIPGVGDAKAKSLTLGQPSSDWHCVSQCEEGQTALAVMDALQNFMHISRIEGGFQTRTRMIEEGGSPDGI